MNNNRNFQEDLSYFSSLIREQDWELIEDIARQFGCKLYMSKDNDGNVLDAYVNATSQQSLNSFMTIIDYSFLPYLTHTTQNNKIYITVNYSYAFVSILHDIIYVLNPFIDYVNKNGGWSNSTSDQISGLEVFEKNLLDSTLPEDVAESVKLLSSLLASYYTFPIECVLPGEDVERVFDYQSDDPDDDYSYDDSNDYTDDYSEDNYYFDDDSDDYADDYSEDDYSSDDDSLN